MQRQCLNGEGGTGECDMVKMDIDRLAAIVKKSGNANQSIAGKNAVLNCIPVTGTMNILHDYKRRQK